jgi:uncharacterized Tic20 family protein
VVSWRQLEAAVTRESDAPVDLSSDARTWALLCHLSAFAGLLGNGIGYLLGPLIVWLIKRQEHPFIDEQGKEAVNFQLTMLLVFVLSLILSCVLIGIPMLIALGILEIVAPIVGAINASNGQHFRYPLTIRFIK